MSLRNTVSHHAYLHSAYSVFKCEENLGLTTVHGFFIVMGGCHRYEIPHPPSEHGYSSVVDITAPTIGNSGSRNSDADADADANDNLPGQSPEVRHSVELVTNQDNREDNREEVSPVYEARNEEDSESQKSRKVGGRPVHPLGRKEVIWLIENKKFDLPIKAEILDKSKSDWIAKGFAILQTSWFILQCITRAVEHLPMAELELVTLAYAIVNMGIYAAWWYKPCKVDRPVRVFAEIPENEDERRKYEQELKFLGNTKRERLIVTAWCYILGDTDKSAYLHDLRRTPTFYSGNPGDTRITIANGVTLTVGLIFGGIHCIAWSFHFPSQVERILWRSASAIIVGIPLLLVIIGGPVSLLWPKGLPLRNRNIFERILMRIAYVIIVAIPILVGVLYVFARAMILVLVFAALRSLPPRAYEAVQWTNFIPHI